MLKFPTNHDGFVGGRVLLALACWCYFRVEHLIAACTNFLIRPLNLADLYQQVSPSIQGEVSSPSAGLLSHTTPKKGASTYRRGPTPVNLFQQLISYIPPDAR